MRVNYIKNGSFMGADISGEILFRSEIMKKINTNFQTIYHPLCVPWIFKLLKK